MELAWRISNFRTYLLAFMCSHSRLTPATPINAGKERAEAGF